jgi:hypothetical protein
MVPAARRFLKGYPDLERKDIRQAIGYAAWPTQEQLVISEQVAETAQPPINAD